MRSKYAFPFSAIVGQDSMKRALLLHAVDPLLGGVLIFGERGTAKSTAVRALASLLPPVRVVDDCPYRCNPDDEEALCTTCRQRLNAGRDLPVSQVRPPFVDLPLGATEDRILGAIDLEVALTEGRKEFQPGLLAEANRGFLYIDEVNLLADHLVDLLLDVVASGENIVEREGLSVRHPARFVLVGSGNPEEGDLRPQLLDRFALAATVSTLTDPGDRAEVLRRRLEYSDNPPAFCRKWSRAEHAVSEQVKKARARLSDVAVTDETYALVAELGSRAGAAGHRAEVAVLRASRAEAALQGRPAVAPKDVRATAPLAFSHRLPFGDDESLVHMIDEVTRRADAARAI